MPKRGRYGGRRPFRTGRTGKAGRMRRKGYRKQRPRGFKNFMSKAKWSGVNWPQVLYKKFEYELGDLLDSTAANVSDVQAFRLNSIYDPAVGSSPEEQESCTNYANFISAIGPYSYWRVVGAKVKMQAINIGGTTAMIMPIISGYQPDFWTPGQSFDQVNDWTMLPGAGEPVFLGPATGSNNRVTKSFYVRPCDALGVTRMQYMTNTGYNGTSDANPLSSQTAFCSFVMIGAGGANAQAQVRVRFKIVYYTILYNPVQETRVVINEDADPIPGA